ncbi:hypothetical protein Salat_1866000 [Sesamum alatum]|uniref:Uncharacterized protein n=1 Tax=Sesamum alatum TaxID=300844 RepID=A0AAE1Y3A7_9LAMI|nr:hypothetical protein Salat_1866000 [Sesamum alatum]
MKNSRVVRSAGRPRLAQDQMRRAHAGVLPGSCATAPYLCRCLAFLRVRLTVSRGVSVCMPHPRARLQAPRRGPPPAASRYLRLALRLGFQWYCCPIFFENKKYFKKTRIPCSDCANYA